MRKQQDIWQKEHVSPSVLPSLAKEKPSDAARYFVEYLKPRNLKDLRAIDIGCGKGRNAVYMAEQGLQVYAMDYIREALDAAKILAEKNNVSSTIAFFNAAIDEPWPFGDNFFDFALDSFSSIDIETAEGRNIYKQEMLRTLKVGGTAFVSVVSADDVQEKAIMAKHSGPEKNSVIWPNGKFQKNYDEQELREFYKEFKILDFQTIKKPVTKLGQNYEGTDLYIILQKEN